MANREYYVQTEDGTVFLVNDPNFLAGSKRLVKAEGKRLYREQFKDSLLKLVKPGDTIYTVLCHRSRSGMSREIALFAVRDGEMVNITYSAAVVMDDKVGSHDGVVIGGCGMDMGFALVYNLGRYLFPEGFKVKGRGRNGDMSGHDNDGGYALTQRWV